MKGVPRFFASRASVGKNSGLSLGRRLEPKFAIPTEAAVCFVTAALNPEWSSRRSQGIGNSLVNYRCGTIRPATMMEEEADCGEEV